METILIIEDNLVDAKETKKVLEEHFDKRYQIEVLGCPDITKADNAELQNFYNSPEIFNKLCEKVEACKNDNPVVGIVIDIFLTEEEEKSLTSGRNLIANTSCKILNEFGNAEDNGIFKADNNGKKINFVIVSRFPRYVYYAKDLSENEKWARYYIGKRDFYDVNNNSGEMQNIKKILSGEGNVDIYGGIGNGSN